MLNPFVTRIVVYVHDFKYPKQMKIIAILLGIVFIAFLAIQVYAMKTQNGIENYPYKVNKKHSSFEIRTYQPTLFTTIKLPPSDYKTSSSKGFSILAGYIFGGNEKNEKIAMTSPVSMSLEDSMTMMFMVPKEYKREDLPKPINRRLNFNKNQKNELPQLHLADGLTIKELKNTSNN